MADCFNQFVGKFIAFNINNVHFRVCPGDFVANGIKQMRFPKTGITVNEQRVVQGCRFICHSHGSRVRKFIGRAYYIGVESKFVIIVDCRCVVVLFFNNTYFFRCAYANLNLLSENLFESFIEQVPVIVSQCLAVELVWNL